MGAEAACTARVSGHRVDGRALLESDHLLFRGGEARVRVPFASVTRVDVEGGRLVVAHAGGVLELDLGPLAARWAEKIRNPKPLIDKLGVKPGARVVLLRLRDAPFEAQLAARTSDVTRRLRKDAHVVFLLAESPRDLERLTAVEAAIVRDGAVWVVTPRGVRDVADAVVIAAGKAAGLVDNKVARFSETHTALRLVVPRARR